MMHADIAFVVVSFAGVFAVAYALSQLKQYLLRWSMNQGRA